MEARPELGQSGDESVMLCENIWFPCTGKRKEEKKKKRVRVQNAIRGLCAVTAGMTVISPLLRSLSQAEGKKRTFPNPFPNEHVTPAD